MMWVVRTFGSLAWVSAALCAFGLIGCSKPDPTAAEPVKPFLGREIRVGAVGDPTILATISPQLGDWTARTGGKVVVVKEPINLGRSLDVDVVVFAGDRLADLMATNALEPIPDEMVKPKPPAKASTTSRTSVKPSPKEADARDPLVFENLPLSYRQHVMKFGDARVAWPFGGSALVLVYRRDLLAAAAKSDLAKSSPVAIAPPQTWSDLDQLALFLHGHDWNEDGVIESGIALPLGLDREQVGLGILLARAASLGQHRDQFSFLFSADTLEPWVSSPPLVEALERLTALGSYGPKGSGVYDSEAAREAFRSGKAVMLIDRAEMVAHWSDPKSPIPVGVAPLPGSMRVYVADRKQWEEQEEPNVPAWLPRSGGWMVGVAANSQATRKPAAADFARYLVEPDTARRVHADRAFPMLALRLDEIAQGPPDPRSSRGVDARLWARAVSKTLNAAVVSLDPRIASSEGYLQELDDARVAAAKGEPASKALERVDRLWKARTEKLGKPAQLRSYRLGLNAFVSDPGPRPR